MSGFKSVEEAIKFLENERGFIIRLRHQAKWEIEDEDWEDVFKTDEDLIAYANEQKADVEANE